MKDVVKCVLKNGFFAPSLMSLAFAVGATLVTAPAASARGQDASPAHRPGEIVIKVRDAGRGGAGPARSALERALGTRAVVGVREFKTDPQLHVVKIARDGDLARALQVLHGETTVLIAEPNFIYKHTATAAEGSRPAARLPNDPDFAKTWGIQNVGQVDAAGQSGKAGADVNVLPVWAEGFHGSKKVVVAVIDTGIDWEHPDLKANLFTNAGEIAGNGIDDDGNGFIDDVHGWNFDAKTNASSDDHDHGTHCAGTIGAVGDNGVGVAGVNWDVTLMPVKFLDRNGSGSLEAAVESINYATMMKVNVMSNSWGGGGFSQTLLDSIVKARDAGILFVAAAGNDGRNTDTSPSYPATYDVANVLSVAATDNRDGIASFSNYGTRTVHVAAPGVKVYSTVKGGKYDAMSGTSMATPHVAGIAALLMSANPGWTFDEIKDRLIKTSEPVRGLKRKVAARGRVNAYNALKGIVPVTDEPDASLWKPEAVTVESVHPYANHDLLDFKIERPGAKYMRVRFEKVEVEANYDKVYVMDGAGVEAVETLTGRVENYTSEYVEGGALTIRLKADESNVGFGFKIDQIEVIY